MTQDQEAAEATDSDRVLAAGVPLELTDSRVVHVRFGLRALKALEDTVGSISAVREALFPTSGTERVVRLARVIAKGLGQPVNAVLDALRREPPEEGAEDDDGFGSLEGAAAVLAPQDDPKRVGPTLMILAATLLHEEGLFAVPGAPGRRDLVSRVRWLEDQLLDLVDPRQLSAVRQAIVAAFLQSTPAAEPGEGKDAAPAPTTTGASTGAGSTSSPRSASAARTRRSGT